MSGGRQPRKPPVKSHRVDGGSVSAVWLLLIFTTAFLVRVIHVWQMARTPFFDMLLGDARSYDEWARRLAAGDWIGHDVFYQAPLYPYFLGVIYRTFGRDLMVVRLIQSAGGSAACVLLAIAGSRFFSRRAGITAGFALALYAPAIFFDGLLQKAALDLLLICVVLFAMGGIAQRGSSRWKWLSLGVALGALSLTRENALVLIAVAALWAVERSIASSPRVWWPAPMLLAGLILVLGPVAVRNSVIGGGFYVTTSQFGPNLYIGNNPHADGMASSLRSGRGAPEFERQDATELAEYAAGHALTPSEVSSYWTEQAVTFIRTQPLAWTRLMWRKFALLWNRTEALDTESQESYAEYSAPLRLLGWIGNFGILVPLAILGIWLTWPERRRLAVLHAMAGTYALSVVAFYVYARYRYPLVPFLLLFAAVPIARAPEFFRAPLKNRSNAFAAGLVAATAIFCNWPMIAEAEMRAISEHNLGAALQSDGRLNDAIEHYRRAIALDPAYAPAYSNMGAALLASGHRADAIAAYEEALAIQPEFPDAHYNLANALMKEGQPQQAIPHFEQALQKSGASVDVHTNLGAALLDVGRAQDAVAEFRVAVKLAPRTAETHHNLGNALVADGMPEAALIELRQAVSLDPSDGESRFDLGEQLLVTHHVAEAAEELRAAVRLTPDSPEAHNNLGIALAQLGRIDEAAGEFRAALGLRPGFSDAQRNLSAALALAAPARR